MNSTNKSAQKLKSSNNFNALQNQALKIQVRQNEANLDKQLGLNPPKNTSPAMLEIWNDFFILIREMYSWKILEANYVRKYCFDFFEMGRKKTNGQPNTEAEEIIAKKSALQNMWASVMKKIETIKELQEMEHIDEIKKINIDIFDSLQTDQEKIEFLTYLNNGEIPEEVQALIDERDSENSDQSQLSQEEIDQLQRKAISNIFGKYSSSHGSLNLGKTGNVVSAEAIDEFINREDEEEAQTLRSEAKIRTMPNLPSLENSPSSQAISQPNLRSNQTNLPNSVPNSVQNSQQKSNFTNSQNPIPQNNIVSSNFTNNSSNSQNNSDFKPQFYQNNSVKNIQNQNQNSQIPRNNVTSFGQNISKSQTVLQNNSQNNSTNSVPNSPVYSNLPNNSNNNLQNPKAILPRTRGLNDLLKK